MQWEVIIGLEVHCQLNTASKIFAPDAYVYGTAPNSLAGPVTLGLPGVLPVLNQEVLHMAIMAGLALNCKIARVTKFDRKHYFYPDLPKGYQISQYDMPYATGGKLSFQKKGDERETVIGITRIHMEEDAGKLLHSQDRGIARSYVDLNRAGAPLLEIVSEPDLRSADDAYEYLVSLKSILRCIGISECNMEEGSLRCDANVSVRRDSAAPLGTRVEIKNLNSFKAVKAAIEYERERQVEVLENGGSIIQSTVLWDADARCTRLMRTKEDAEDYRYFPDPDLLPFEIPQETVDQIFSRMPELPQARKARFQKDYDLPPYDSDVLSRERDLADYFEAVAHSSKDPKKASNWVKDEVLGILNKNDLSINAFPVAAAELGSMIRYLNEGQITGKMAKQIFEHMHTEGLGLDTTIEKYNYKPVAAAALPAIVKKVIQENPEVVAKIKAGNDRVKGFLVGQVMKATNGQAPPDEVNRILDQEL
ncbi:MAG: Asp-tRNA(Asn)/Glu-tRNA(Gln) amidotransferase subunit GatB [Spirochaetales bacterium]|nr:Asp-tRNA(Asn)/Glu-tRNA(Gln) amidotransferase subunit GatB [Spirochaetales bacterium]